MNEEVRADQRVLPAQRVDERDRDDRQGQRVRQQPLVEVGRQADDQRHEPRPEQREGQRVRAEAERQEPEGDGPDDGRDRRPPVHATAGRVLLVVLRPAGREAVRGQPEGQPGPGEQPGQRLHGS